MTTSHLKRLNITNLLAWIGAIAVYALGLWLPIPAEVGLFVRYNLVFTALIAIPLFYFAFNLKGVFGTLAVLSLTLLLFGLPLSGLWRSGASEPFIIGGLLPFSDAASYYSDALRVVEGYRFSAFSARRPLFPALLTLLLAVTGENLVLSIGILGMMIGIACYLAAREVQRSLGNLPAAVFLFVLFLFYRRIAGTTMTENLGLPLGVAAFVVLWSGAQKKQLFQTAAGLLILTLALNARAGTFFILPALILWSGFAFRGKRRFSLAVVALNTAAVALGFLLNMLVFKLVADPGGMVFSNFSYTLYGVVAGGKGWMQILIDHPELAQLDDVARSAQTYALVFETWKAHPFNIVIGALKNWYDYLLPGGSGAFGFVRGSEAQNWVNYAVRILLSLFAVLGLVKAWRKRREEPFTMMLWAAVGIFLSVPFVPPTDANQMRVYAATVTFLITFSVIGVHTASGWFLKKPQEKLEKTDGKPAMVFGLTLAAAAICGVLLVKGFAKPEELPLADCPLGQTQFLTRFTPGSLVGVGSAGEHLSENQLTVPLSDFVAFNEGYVEMHTALVGVVGQGAVLARPLDLLSMQYPLLVLDEDPASDLQGMMNICAVQPTDEELMKRGWWLVESAASVSAEGQQ